MMMNWKQNNLEPSSLGLVPMVIETSGRGERLRYLFPIAERARNISRRPRHRSFR